MENWITKISCAACWEWWDIVMASLSVSGTGVGYYIKKITSDRKLDEILDRHIIDDLKFIEEYMEWWEDNQGPDGRVDFVRKGRENAKKLFEFPVLIAKHRDWISVDYTPEERAKGIRLDASNSIDAIRRYGHKKAKKIRKEELQNPSQKEEPRWNPEILYPKKKH